MSIFARLAIGTANWNKPYGLSGKQVSNSEQEKILAYCQSSGIDMLDCATAYGTEDVGNSYFNKVVKVNKNDSVSRLKEIVDGQPYCLMAHDLTVFDKLFGFIQHTGIKKGISIYESSDFSEYFKKAVGVVQVPYSIYDRRIERHLKRIKDAHVEIHVRSIFLQGKILEKFTPQDCISFCLMNPCIDRVIIGVDSCQQLRDNLRFLHRMNSAEVHDEKIIDPRKWPCE